ncbi:MAG: hypothetical protein WC612_03890 [Bdellovibrionales bacterium]|jgi:hypothetical protein
MRSFVRPFLLVGLLVLSGCVPFWRQWMGPQAPAKPYTVLPPHENWCYSTLGQIECYTKPQRLLPESLVSVDPPSRFPLTREAYAKALAEAQKPSK